MQLSLHYDYRDHNIQSTDKHGIVANEFVLSYKKTPHLDPFRNERLNNSWRISGFLRKIWDSNRLNFQESFYVIFFRNMKLAGYMKLADGSADCVMVDVRFLFSSALLSGATQIILAHNHPSETNRPSDADIKLTNKVVEAGKLLEVQVLDPIILCGEEYYSFRDNGLL